MKMLPGRRSRCTTPAACARVSARAAWVTTLLVCSRVSRQRLRSLLIVSEVALAVRGPTYRPPFDPTMIELGVVPTELGRVGGLICWENYMPLARFHLYAQGVEVWVAPTLARGDGWIATMRHIAREGRVWVVGVNPCVRIDQIPADFPNRDRVWRVMDEDEAEWVEPGNSVICNPNGEIVAGPLRYEEGILTAEVDLTRVNETRRLFDPVGHYHRPDIFQLTVDTRPRRAVTLISEEPVGDSRRTPATGQQA